MGGGVSSEALPKELEGKDVYTLDEIKAAFGDKFDEAKAEEALKGIETRDAISRQTVEAALGLGSGGEESQGAAAAADAGTAAAQSTGESATESVAPPAAPAVSDGVTILEWNVAGINSNAFEFLQESGHDEKDPFNDVLRFAGMLDTYLGTIAGKIDGADEKVRSRKLRYGQALGRGNLSLRLDSRHLAKTGNGVGKGCANDEAHGRHDVWNAPCKVWRTWF